MRLTHRNPLLKQVASSGVRLTRQRRVLIEALQGAEEHVDAAALLELARKRDPQINRATVYRTLDVLKKLRLIDELDLMHLQGEKHYFEPRTVRDHCHLACFRCGSIVEYASPAFEALKAEIACEEQLSGGCDPAGARRGLQALSRGRKRSRETPNQKSET